MLHHLLYKCERVLLPQRNFLSIIFSTLIGFQTISKRNQSNRTAKSEQQTTSIELFTRSVEEPAGMAVQAQYLSKVFPSDFQSRVEAGGVLEGMQMMLQTHNHQIGQLFNAAMVDAPVRTGGLNNASVMSDYLQSDVTCNVFSSCRKRRRDEPMVPLQAYQYHQTGFQVSSNGLSFPVLESAGPSTSGVSSVSHLPLGSDLSPELLSLLYQQSNEIDALVRHQCERLRLGMEASRKRDCLQILSSLSNRALKRLREKEIELENVKRRNADLEEKTRQIAAESLIWFNLAKNNEAVVSTLKTSLEQAMIHGIAAASAAPSPREGFGESDCSAVAADDALSCCYETGSASPAPASGELRRRLVCKVCNENDAGVLVLPCRHLCLCTSCESSVDTCPSCRSHKNATLQIFMS